MALVEAESSAVKSNRRSNPTTNVRIIGKIRVPTNAESESLGRDSKAWITVKNPEENGSSEKCKVYFETQSTRLSTPYIKKRDTSASSLRTDSYELDYCYEQHEEIDRIYSREIKPLVLDLFEGRNASVIALGAKGSGKTDTIQGSQEKPGLAVMAVSEILAKAKELGKSVSISLYELTQENVKDLLNPSHPSIKVLDDAHGKANIIGLSKVPVNSITEFHDMYFSQGCSQNTQKVAIDQPQQKGLMVHIASDDEKTKARRTNKINFVDLAGYEDIRKNIRQGNTPVQSNLKNKSLYALLNVIGAVSANETWVPYRESKLTRILQDSLCGGNHVLLLTCLNPCFCHDSLSSINLISRSCRTIKQVLTDSTNINRSRMSAKVKVVSAVKNGKTMSASLSSKKSVIHSRLLNATNGSHNLKGRKLFDEGKKANSKQLRCQSEDTSRHKSKSVPCVASVVAPFSLDEAPEDVSNLNYSSSLEQIEESNSEAPGPECMSKMENAPSATTDDSTTLIKTVSNLNSADSELLELEETISDVNVPMQFEAGSKCEENNYIYRKGDASPPLSERVREIRNNLKAICESTPTIMMPEEMATPCKHEVLYNDSQEPKTPAMDPSSARYCSPWGTFSNRSTKLKHSVVKECLDFLNSANKEELKSLKGIGEKRATYIMEMREESPEPFKSLDDLQDIGLSEKQVKGMMKQVAGGLF